MSSSEWYRKTIGASKCRERQRRVIFFRVLRRIAEHNALSSLSQSIIRDDLPSYLTKSRGKPGNIRTYQELRQLSLLINTGQTQHFNSTLHNAGFQRSPWPVPPMPLPISPTD